MSVLQRGDRLVVSELSRLGRSLGQITERWSGRSFTCGSAVAVRRFLEVLDRRLHLVGVPRWPVGVAGQPRYSDLAAGGDQPDDRTLRTVVVAQVQVYADGIASPVSDPPPPPSPPRLRRLK